jgi:hypothetical protein
MSTEPTENKENKEITVNKYLKVLMEAQHEQILKTHLHQSYV